MRIEIFEMIVIIVAVYYIYKTVTDLSRHKANHKAEMDEIGQRVGKIEELEERIKVLEKIVTDKNYDLKDQIDSLK
jgi:energy-converting hydrogenase Eha subunit H